MTAYSVLAVTPKSEDWIEQYLPNANALVKKHGGRYLARTAEHEQVEGDDRPAALRIVIEWPSRAAAIAFEEDPEYQPYRTMRLENSDSYHYVIEGKDDLA